MNDYGRDLAGMRAVLKPRNFWKKPSSDKERTLTILSGAGCHPEFEWGRNIRVKHATSEETISSYDIAYIFVDGKKIYPQESMPAEVYVCDRTVTYEPEPEAKPEKTKLVRRKR